MEGIMLVGINERIRLLGILPEQGNLLTIKIVRTLREALSFSEEEHKEFNVQIADDRITWNPDAPEKEIEFGDMAKEIIEKRLRELNEKDELTVADIGLWEKFIGEV
jgi:hypothetical protein